MTQEHPITPPPELMQQWFLSAKAMPVDQWVTDVATQAARWGADQELEACCEWLRKDLDAYELVGLRAVYLDHNLHNARRPKASGSKDQAMALLELFSLFLPEDKRKEANIIRHALESLPD